MSKCAGMDSVNKNSVNSCSREPSPRLFTKSLNDCLKDRCKAYKERPKESKKKLKDSKEKLEDSKEKLKDLQEKLKDWNETNPQPENNKDCKYNNLHGTANRFDCKIEGSLKQSPNHCELNPKRESPQALINHCNAGKYDLIEDICSENVDKHFSKLYEFSSIINNKKLTTLKPRDYFTADKWKIKHLMDLKFRLNEVKSKLDNLNLADWHRHTKSTNSAAAVQQYLRNHIDPELLTQAWCKFHEVISTFCLIPKRAVEDRRLNSVHLCEAPGAFVASLNHYLKTKRPLVVWEWMATTLNPYHEQNEHSYMINDDRLIFNTIDKWDFGVDATGDVFNPLNMKHIVENVKTTFKNGVMLVTADGSFDCQSCPGEQESMVVPLLYCEVITAIHILQPGGSLLLKMFTIFECETICLLYLLHELFGAIKIFKPVTSKEGNSEVYLVCLYFNPPSNIQELQDLLFKNYDYRSCTKAMFDLKTLPKEFIDQVIKCAEFFEEHQA